jgi:enoyl-CoA hydratase/carnithine racemase
MSKYSGISSRSSSFDNILYEKKHWVATVTINRPTVHNCLNLETLRELGTAFEDAAWDDHIAVLVLTGAGEKAFCTGADLKEWKEDFLDHPNNFHKWMGVFIETFERLRNLGKPTIAKLNGIVVGGGNELQMSCASPRRRCSRHSTRRSRADSISSGRTSTSSSQAMIRRKG